MTRPTRRIELALLVLIVTLAGCSDERLVTQAERASDRQAEQNRQIAHQNQHLAEATNRLVTADAQARSDTLSLQRELQAEQTKIGVGRDELEGERRELAHTRYRDPIVAAVLTDLGLVLACLLPLVLCGYLLRGLKHEPTEAELAELLAVELVSETPVLLPAVDRDVTGTAGVAQPRGTAGHGFRRCSLTEDTPL